MNLPALLARFFILAAAGLLAGVYWLAVYQPVSLVIVGLALLGLLFLQRGWYWVVSLLLVLYTGSAAAGFYLELQPAWLAGAALSILAAWDLEYFARRLKNAGRVVAQSGFIRSHLLRLSWVSLLGLALFAIPNLIRLQFTFGLAVLLALLAVYGLSQGIAYLRRTSN
jgi:hypothetical protein